MLPHLLVKLQVFKMKIEGFTKQNFKNKLYWSKKSTQINTNIGGKKC